MISLYFLSDRYLQEDMVFEVKDKWKKLDGKMWLKYFENGHRCVCSMKKTWVKRVYFITTQELVKNMEVLEQLLWRRVVEFLVNAIGVPKQKEVSLSSSGYNLVQQHSIA